MGVLFMNPVYFSFVSLLRSAICNLDAKVSFDISIMKDNLIVDSRSLARERKCNKKKETMTTEGKKRKLRKFSVIPQFSNISVLYYKSL